MWDETHVRPCGIDGKPNRYGLRSAATPTSVCQRPCARDPAIGERRASDPAGDPEDQQHDADYYPGGGNLAQSQAACQDDGRDGFHVLHWQRQPVE